MSQRYRLFDNQFPNSEEDPVHEVLVSAGPFFQRDIAEDARFTLREVGSVNAEGLKEQISEEHRKIPREGVMEEFYHGHNAAMFMVFRVIDKLTVKPRAENEEER